MGWFHSSSSGFRFQSGWDERADRKLLLYQTSGYRLQDLGGGAGMDPCRSSSVPLHVAAGHR